MPKQKKQKMKEKVRFGDLKRGQGFEYRNNYYIKDREDSSVQLTGSGTGIVCSIKYFTEVRPVVLLVEEE